MNKKNSACSNKLHVISQGEGKTTTQCSTHVPMHTAKGLVNGQNQKEWRTDYSGQQYCLLSKNKPSGTVTNILKAGTGPERNLPHTVFGGHNLTVQDRSAPLSLIFLECVLTEMTYIFGGKKENVLNCSVFSCVLKLKLKFGLN